MAHEDDSLRGVSDQFWNSTGRQNHIVLVLQQRGMEAVCDKVAFRLSFGNIAVFDTADGLVLVDTSGTAEVWDDVQKYSSRPVHTCIYTHGHIDHVMGMRGFEKKYKDKGQLPPRVVAHENVVARFDRYKLTRDYNTYINARQFQRADAMFPRNFRYPDVTYQTELVLKIGEFTFCLFHDKGETDDATWVWVPELKVLCTGDMFIWASPNCGNPQKVQRYPLEWSAALKKMQQLGAEYLLPGHGPPIFGADRIQQALSDTYRFLDIVNQQTLDAINQGRTLNQILHSIQIPTDLLSKPYLSPVYDDPKFIVHNLWRRYAGWWDQNPAHLRPPRDDDLGKEVVAIAGGATKICHRVQQLLSQLSGRGGDDDDDGYGSAPPQLDIAVQLIEFAVQAEPRNVDVHTLRERVYLRKMEAETSLMAKSIYRAAAADSATALADLGQAGVKSTL